VLDTKKKIIICFRSGKLISFVSLSFCILLYFYPLFFFFCLSPLSLLPVILLKKWSVYLVKVLLFEVMKASQEKLSSEAMQTK
jgi:hypothetical protein